MFRDNVIAKYNPSDPNYYSFVDTEENEHGYVKRHIKRYRMTAFEAKKYRSDGEDNGVPYIQLSDYPIEVSGQATNPM